MARSAADDDADVAKLWRTGNRGHRRDCERFARAALGKNAGPALHALTATLYVHIGTETYTLLSDELGFTPPAYERWLRSQLEVVFQGASR